MKFKDFIKEKLILIIIYIFIIFLIAFILDTFDLITPALVMVVFLLVLFGIVFIFYGFIQRKNFYNQTLNILDHLDNKSLITETMPEAYFIEGEMLKKILRITEKYKLEQINKYKFKEQDFEEFMELWVHEIKTPLSTINLITENNPGKVSDSIKEEIVKINNYVELILFYARSQNLEKDYIIKNTNLKDVINKVMINFKKDFILKNISLDIHGIDYQVKTDSKWLEFISKQIISNSLKYLKENPKISIYAKKNKENIALYFEDNGIGIDRKDLPRIFDKGFTGQNGRSKYNSTGMGLYLVKTLCDKLSHGVTIESEVGKGTIVKITFPLGSMTKEIERKD